MLELSIQEKEIFIEDLGEFRNIKATKLQLEHSLISLQNWEKKWHIPFLGKEEKTEEQMMDYIKCMTITPNVDPIVYTVLSPSEIGKIKEYIDNPMTATWFSENNSLGNRPGKKEIITAEIIYYWMISLGIPPEYRKWHLNQLLTLIRVMSIKNSPPKKMGKKSILSQNAKLNAERRARNNSKG